MSAAAKNSRYLGELIASIQTVHKEIAADVMTRVYEKAVWNTKIDSAQAAFQWYIEPFVGTPSYEPQKVLWGFKGQAPTAPVGQKGSKLGPEYAEILIGMKLTAFDNLVNSKYDGIVVYNPIEPGFAGFQPGDDSKYFDNAFSEVDLEAFIQEAMEESEAAFAGKYQFLRKR